MPDDSNSPKKIVIFDNQDLKLEVNLVDDTVWLNRTQIAQLFGRDVKTIDKHIKNALEEELKDEVVVAKFATTTQHGAITGKVQTHQVNYYNLEMITSVGYRVKSKNGIIFRRWANKVIKDYLIKGYAANKQRLADLERTVQLIPIAYRAGKLGSDSDAKEILRLLDHYSFSLKLLNDYDKRQVQKQATLKSDRKILFSDCENLISALKTPARGELFGVEREPHGLESIILNIYQSFDEQDVYTTVEEKLANLLYLVVKNHVFIDGNKRIAAALFIYALDYYGLLFNENAETINNTSLTALTLLVAESKPNEKETMINLITNLIHA